MKDQTFDTATTSSDNCEYSKRLCASTYDVANIGVEHNLAAAVLQ